ncbi:MAG TPA: hypothetical protein VKH43_03275 [Thermoanaerobaculia bacterium]|nr:hypothetical protein [Thermoanaerobaculia bacterium]
MRDEKEIRAEIRAVRDRGKSLSGFWVAELAAAAYALEWALGKHGKPPSEDIGTGESAQGRIAASLVKAAQIEAESAKKKAPPAKKEGPPPKKEAAAPKKGKSAGPLRRVK